MRMYFQDTRFLSPDVLTTQAFIGGSVTQHSSGTTGACGFNVPTRDERSRSERDGRKQKATVHPAAWSGIPEGFGSDTIIVLGGRPPLEKRGYRGACHLNEAAADRVS